MAQDVERLKKLQQLVAEQESLIRRMIVRGTPNQADEDRLSRLKLELAPQSWRRAANGASQQDHDGRSGSKFIVDATRLVRQLYPWQLTDLCSAAKGRRVPNHDSCTATSET
jgi:hypothetical protein